MLLVLLDKATRRSLYLGLIDIIFAFAYDNRTTLGENSVREVNKSSPFSFIILAFFPHMYRLSPLGIFARSAQLSRGWRCSVVESMKCCTVACGDLSRTLSLDTGSWP